MIGIDLDGVLVADVDYSEEIVRFRDSGMKAIFVPHGDYAIITGRPNASEVTKAWIRKELVANPPFPNDIYCENTDWRISNEYKISVLKLRPDIDIFIESDPSVVEILRHEFPNRQIVHFGTWVSTILSGIRRSAYV